MRHIVVCRACGARLSVPLGELPPEVPLGRENGRDLVPAGAFTRRRHGSVSGQVLIRAGDARNVRPHPDSGRRAGCCGLDGLDGPNVVCACGAEVGTEWSDCWMPHALALEPGATALVDADAPDAH